MKRVMAVLMLGVFIVFTADTAFPQGQTGSAYRQELRAKKQAYRDQKKSEAQAFRESLKLMDKGAKQKAMADYRAKRAAEDRAFGEKLHQENMVFLKAKLANNQKLSEGRKNELVNLMESRYQDSVSFREKQQTEGAAFYRKIEADDSMAEGQKESAVRAHKEKQKAEYRNFREEAREKIKAVMQALNAGAGK